LPIFATSENGSADLLTRMQLARLRAAILGTFLLLPIAAKASDTGEEIRLLKARLQQLEGKVARRERAAEARAKEAKAVQSAGPAATGAGDVGPRGPDYFTFKGIRITPGGFIAAQSVWRSSGMGADTRTPWGNIPYGFLPGAHIPEFRMSARASRASLRVNADIDSDTHITGYGEFDFLGAAQTANSNQSNSYNPRLRLAYANVDFDAWGLHILAGQIWSLATMNAVGISQDTALRPETIDNGYAPGYVWARQPGFQITKDINQEFWFSFGAESGATTYAIPGPSAFGAVNLPTNVPGVTAPVLVAPPASGGLFNAANNYSFNRMPDFIAKAAWDTSVADHNVHVEGFGLLRDMTDRAYWGNHSQWAGGVGAGVIVSVIPKILEFQFSGMVGRGIGRYGTSQISDATFQISGAVQPISERMALLGVTLHATPQMELYAFAGGEFAGKQPQWSIINHTLYVGGYGNPFYNNSGCGFENDTALAAVAATTSLLPCAGQTKDVRQLTGGVWQTLYRGPYGRVRVGAQYSYTLRDSFVGLGATPRATEHTWLSALRYYPFDGTSASITPIATKF
jgi:hypothetical protein